MQQFLHTDFCVFGLSRRKYELQQFLDSDECIMCPYPRPTCSSTYRSASTYRSESTKNLMLTLDKKHIEKQVSSLRIPGIGNALRSGRHNWKKKDEHKHSKDCDLMVNISVSCNTLEYVFIL